MTPSDFHWLAGYLEGEGSFQASPPSDPNTPYITVSSTDEDVIVRVAALFRVCYTRPKRRHAHWKQEYRVTFRGGRAADMMRRLRPLMGGRRRRQIDLALATYDPSVREHRRRLAATIPSLEELARMHRDLSLAGISGIFGCSRATIWRRLRQGRSVTDGPLEAKVASPR